MQTVSASAPGKVILFGEHAVVYHRPAIAVPVKSIQTTVTIKSASLTEAHITAPQIHLSKPYSQLAPTHPLRIAIQQILDHAQLPDLPPVHIDITSTIPIASGLGSGAAVSVALLRALSQYFILNLTTEEINRYAYNVERIHHGTPSGIDNTVITYEKPVFFQKGNPIEILEITQPFTLVVADTGIRAPTAKVVSDVRAMWQENKPLLEGYFDQIGTLARQARRLIETGNPDSLGALMTRNHALLQMISVSSPELDALVQSAMEADALGAKLSGGGRGGNMIALAQTQTAESIKQALLQRGAVRAFITTVGREAHNG